MSLVADLCQQIYDTPLATAIRESDVTFPALETAHVLGLALIAGTIAIVDLRLLGVVLTEVPAEDIERRVVPATWAGFLLMAATGGLLFAAEAAKLHGNPAFQLKLGLMALAGVNVVLFHAFLKRRLTDARPGARLPAPVQASAAASLTLWAGVIAAGRAIAYFHGGAA
jgi:Family of unknown function (DUF6644)